MKYILLILALFLSYEAQSQIDLTFGLNFDVHHNRRSEIKIKDDVSDTTNSIKVVPETKLLASPELIKVPSYKISVVEKAVEVLKKEEKIDAPAVFQISKIDEPHIKNYEDFTILKLDKMTPDEYKLLQGLIFFEKHKKSEPAISLFAELQQNSIFKNQSMFEYAKVILYLGLNNVYRARLLELLQTVSEIELKKQIATNILLNIKYFKIEDMKKIHAFMNAAKIQAIANNDYNLRLGKFFIKEGDLNSAEEILLKIPAKTELINEALLLLSTISYRKGDLSKAIIRLESTKEFINKTNKKDALRNLMAVTLARLYFQKSQFQQSYQMYLLVDRTSTISLQSVTEQAWAQILAGDNIGAAGNMFSLHTEIFRKVYVPDSYIIRSASYLNLCQYGDALHVLTDLDNRYRPIYEKMLAFQSHQYDNTVYYELVKSWFSNTNSAEINSVPRSVIAELAVLSAFRDAQKKINITEEQLVILDKVFNAIQLKELSLRKYLTELNEKVQSTKGQNFNKEILGNNRKVAHIEIELQALNSGRHIVQKLFSVASQQLSNEKVSERQLAASALKEKFAEMSLALGKIIEQEEILAYEIYSGAGEHLRYQMGGGKIDETAANSLTSDEKKSYKWKFRGEIWEDEIGHYRSSLKNVCAQKDIALIKKGDQQ